MNKDVRAGDRKGKGKLWGKGRLQNCGLLGSGTEMISLSLSLGKSWVCGWEEWGDRPQPDQRVVVILMTSAEKVSRVSSSGMLGKSPHCTWDSLYSHPKQCPAELG